MLLGLETRTEEQEQGELVKLTAEEGTKIEPSIRAAIVASVPTPDRTVVTNHRRLRDTANGWNFAERPASPIFSGRRLAAQVSVVPRLSIANRLVSRRPATCRWRFWGAPRPRRGPSRQVRP